MSRPPRRPDTSILDGLFIWRVIFVSLLMGGATMAVFVVERQMGMSVEQARTLAVNTLVMGELFYLFNCRSLRASSLRGAMLHTNRVSWAAAGILVLLQLGFVYLPFMQTWFGTVPLELRHWLVPIGIGAILFLIVEMEKAVLRRFFPAV